MEVDKRESGCMFQVRPLKGKVSFGYLEQVAPGWLRSQPLLFRCVGSREMHTDQGTPNAVKQELCWVLAMELLYAAGRSWSLPRSPCTSSGLMQRFWGTTGAGVPRPLLLLLQISVCNGTAEEGVWCLHRAGLFLSIQKSK